MTAPTTSPADAATEASVRLRRELADWAYTRPVGIDELLDANDALVDAYHDLQAKFDRVVSCR